MTTVAAYQPDKVFVDNVTGSMLHFYVEMLALAKTWLVVATIMSE